MLVRREFEKYHDQYWEHDHKREFVSAYLGGMIPKCILKEIKYGDAIDTKISDDFWTFETETPMGDVVKDFDEDGILIISLPGMSSILKCSERFTSVVSHLGELFENTNDGECKGVYDRVDETTWLISSSKLSPVTILEYIESFYWELCDTEYDPTDVGYNRSKFFGSLMDDGKIFSPYIHRRFLPSKYLSMVQGDYLLSAHISKFVTEIRFWLGLEVTSIEKMSKDPRLSDECLIRISLLGKGLYNDLQKFIKGSNRSRYLREKNKAMFLAVPREWIYEHYEGLYMAYLACGCYYTIVSLQSFGVLTSPLEGTIGTNDIVEIKLTDNNSDLDKTLAFVHALRDYDKFRETLSKNIIKAINKGGKEVIFRNSEDGVYLKNTSGAKEKYKEFFKANINNTYTSNAMLSKMGIPTVSLGQGVININGDSSIYCDM